MIELLERVATDHPEREAVVTDEAAVTYGQLLQDARRVASALRAERIERFAIIDHDAAVVAALLGGAAIVGAEACQYPPTADAAETASLAARLDHEVLVTARTELAIAASAQNMRFLAPAELLSGAPTHAEGSEVPATPAHDITVGDRPLLVLTTGTTGVPRGVRHDWTRLLRGTAHVQPATTSRWLLSYGLHQFAGLQILLHVCAAGATLVAPAPRRPREGLAAMRRHQVDHASATPTYWRFLLAEMRADGGPVPDLVQITLGGEAIPGPLLDDLKATFPNANITQVYAASEFGSTGSTKDGRSGLSIDVLDRPDDAPIAMRIVDGELWVRSRVGMLGYYGDPPGEPDAWRPTGDLVEVVGDRIHFRGRVSEVINVGGVKVHPLPIEERIAALTEVSMARVFGRASPMTGSIVAVEAILTPGIDPAAAKAAIRSACAELQPAARPRSITFVDSVAMTQNKIVRGGSG